MPSKRALDGNDRDIAHPINSGTRDRIQKIILDKYAEVLEETETRKLQKSKYRKILKTKIPETGSKTSSRDFYILRNDISTMVNRA